MSVGALRGVTPVDGVVTALLLVLGTLLMLGNIHDTTSAVPPDSHSWWMLPVFLAAAVPVLWWRRDLVLVTGIAIVVMGGHDLAFGHLVRCGAGLPLAFLLSFLAGTSTDRRRGLVALALSGVLSGLVLAVDTAAGPSILPVVLLIQVVLWGVGAVVRSRSALAVELRRRNAELAALRDERAALEVADDRARVSRELEELLEHRLEVLEQAAVDAGATDDPEQARAALAALEEDSRQVLADMRRVVGTLRGGDVALVPSPTVAHLDTLIGRHVRAPLTVTGDPRALPASVELSAYRIVEHLVTALADDLDAPVEVGVRFTDAALEIVVAGPVPRGADLRGAVSRARERTRLHAGSLDARLAHGHARVVAQLPVLTG
jgi:signal transduction histidine kinase